jgi:hypothetical protein
MKLTMSVAVITVSTLFFSGCSEGVNHQTALEELKQDSIAMSQKEMNRNAEVLISRVMSPEDFNIQLNNGSKWVLEAEPLKKILQLKQQIYVISGNMENYEVSSYQMLGEEISQFIADIDPPTDGPANREYQKIIIETQNQCIFLLGTNLQESQVAVINLSNLYDEVPKFFVGAEK